MVDYAAYLSMAQGYIEQFKAILPPQIQEFWYLVILAAFLIFILVIVNIAKLFRRSSHNHSVQNFKQQHRVPSPPPPPQKTHLTPKHHRTLNWDQRKPTPAPKPEKDLLKLDQFIRAQLEAEFSVETVKKNLVGMGWDTMDVHDAINRVHDDMQRDEEPPKKSKKSAQKESEAEKALEEAQEAVGDD